LTTAALVRVVPATEVDRPLIERLIQLYVHDFSELEPPGSDRFEVGADGLFEPYPALDAYWGDASRWPLIIHIGGAVVGFALIDAEAHGGAAVDRNMAEFFVLRKHRRGGVAREAARQIFQRHPGRWAVAVAERNLVALAFWPKAISGASNVEGLEAVQGDGVRWRGPIWRFVAR
jgi:predicted acetyltransferase